MCQEVFVGSAGDDVKKAVQLSQVLTAHSWNKFIVLEAFKTAT